MLPNSTDKFREVIEGSMRVTNYPRAWGRKPCLVCENRDNSNRRENGQGFSEIILLRPYLLLECLNGAKYLVFLQHVIPELLQGVPATALQNVCARCTMEQ
ncbi:hypothetical protein TNCV_4836151 [Trichonephila clavipes]|nr:hypothetical protein TNCV_4836151 [Trichonephila clavipes]